MNFFKKICSGVTDGERFQAILFATLFILFFKFAFSLELTHISLIFKISSALADTCVIVLPCMFLKGKWRYVAIVMTFLISILLYANILYYRNFADLIQPSSYLNADLGDTTVRSGAISSFHISDILFLFLPLCPLSYLIWRSRKALYSPINSKWKISVAALCVMSWGVSYAGVFRRLMLWYPDYTSKDVTELIFDKSTLTWRDFYEYHNFAGYTVICLINSFNIGMELTPDDIESIRCHLSDNAEKRSFETIDSIASHKGQNLIMIIVESLPYKALLHPEAPVITPTLMKAMKDSSAIVSKCRVLADYGRSSDAQFIFNTGLLPLKHEALVDNYALNDYPSLAKAFGHPSMEIIGENKRLWLHSLTTKGYGFDTLIDNVAPDGLNQDSIIFKRAEIEVSKLKSPFFLFITTISMHDPYEDHKVSDIVSIPSILTGDKRDREYFARLHHFDKNLGKFLATLKSKGIYDNSIIVILGDHEIRASKISADLQDDHVPFIILNSPLKSKDGLTTTQLDVFPSILDMMGFRYPYLGIDYSGLGQSIFSSKAQSEHPYSPSEKDYEISEMLIKGIPSM